MRNKLLENLSSGNETQFFSNAIEQFLNARRFIKTDDIPQLPAELAIIEICGFGNEPATAPTEPDAPPVSPPVNFNNQGVDSSRPPETKSKEQEVKTEAPAEPLIQAKAEEPTETSEKVFDSVPVIGLDEIKDKWPEIFKQITECNASLPLMMKGCEVESVAGKEVKLGFDYDLYVQAVNKEKNRTIVENVLERVLGKSVKIRAVLTKTENDDTVNKLLEDFGGSVV